MGRRRSRRSRKKSSCVLRPPERDWTELHPDLISCFMKRLDQVELLIGGVATVCRSWRRAREEPDLWRRIDLRGGMNFVPPFGAQVSLPSMVRAALRHSAGQCEAFLCDRVCDDSLLAIAMWASSLKSLHLITSEVSREGFAKAIKMLPLLEELEISLRSRQYQLEAVELVAGACPLMKHFRLVSRYHTYGNKVAFVVARMSRLRSLHLVRLPLDNQGLTTILDSCHDLEYLNMRYLSPIAMDDSLRVKLSRIHVDDAREYMDDSDYSSDDDDYYTDFYDTWSYQECAEESYDAYCYYRGDGDDVADADIEEYEKILDIKSMRRYLS
ncbi:hypothetical protein ACQ4PT_016773 [Festuca glaucescens]